MQIAIEWQRSGIPVVGVLYFQCPGGDTSRRGRAKARNNAMKIKNLLLLLILVLPVSAQADPLLGKAMAGDRNLPRAFGIGIDYFSMDHALSD